jgi:hypothetical protein
MVLVHFAPRSIIRLGVNGRLFNSEYLAQVLGGTSVAIDGIMDPSNRYYAIVKVVSNGVLVSEVAERYAPCTWPGPCPGSRKGVGKLTLPMLSR